MSQYFSFFLIAAFLGFVIWKQFRFRAVHKNLSRFITDGALIIDVRTPEEFRSGHFEKSINIPLSQLRDQAKSLDQNKTILLCCASGSRSGLAAFQLKGLGFKKVVNGGSWVGLKNRSKI